MSRETSRREFELKNKDKTVLKMSRDGLVEQNLSQGTEENISHREQEADFGAKPGAPPPEDTRAAKRHRAEKKSQKANAKAANARQKLPHQKRLTSRLAYDTEQGKVKRKLQFEEQPVSGKPGIVKTGGKQASRMMSAQVHKKMYQVEQENVGTKAAHRTELAAESSLRGISHLRGSRNARLRKRAEKLEKKAAKARANLSYERALQKNPALAKKNMLQKQQYKRKLKKTYVKQAKQAAKQAEKTARAGAKATVRAASFIARHPIPVLIIIVILLLVLLFAALFATVGTMTGQAGLTILGGSYAAEDAALNQAELYYTELETNLYLEAYAQERTHPGYDEYRYHLGELSHNPYELMAYLSAKYGDFTFEEVKPELERIFARQYHLWTEEETQVRRETKTVQVGESIGEVIATGYCQCSICCGQWAGGPTASGVMPKANHTLAVDAKHPIVPMGTKIVMNNTIYTVEDTGNFDRYGVAFDIFFDTHAEALAWGRRSVTPYLAEGNQNTVEITTETTVRILHINLSAGNLSPVLLSSMDSDEKSMYDTYLYTRGMRFYFSSPFEELDWTAYLSSGYGYRIHPISGAKDLHKAVDIGVPAGTSIKAAQHGTVTYAGWDQSYGNYVMVEDEEGLKSLYAHCSSLSVSAGQSVVRGDEIGKVGSTGNSTGPHLHLEVSRDGLSLNPLYFVDPGKGGEWQGGGMTGYPGEAYDNETYQRLLNEATKYIGYPYVWGGSTPSTSFDCSGFVSWVYTQSGVYNIGRDTAQGIYNRCVPVSAADARPGDLLFFTGTYSTTSYITHIAIYVGNGQMLHAGNPIGYASINTPYWQQHFAGYGRLK